MAKSNNDALLMGALGFGVGMLIGNAMSSNAPERRARFRARLRDALATHFVELVGAEVASGREGREWRVTMMLPDRQVQTLRAPLAPDVDALAEETCDDVIRRVLQYLRERGAVA